MKLQVMRGGLNSEAKLVSLTVLTGSSLRGLPGESSCAGDWRQACSARRRRGAKPDGRVVSLIDRSVTRCRQPRQLRSLLTGWLQPEAAIEGRECE